MNRKTFSKILAIMLVITLTFANFVFLAVYAGKSYAADVNYEKQETGISKTNVSFDAYFISENGEKKHTQVTEMNNSELKLFLNVSVTQGYLKDARVTISNSNFRLVKGEELPNGVGDIDTENNTVMLNQINKGETREIALAIEVLKDEKFDLSNFSKDAEVKLTGKYINNSGKEIKTEKAIIVNLALSENAESYLTAKVSKYAIFEEENSKKALLQLNISSKVVDNLLPVKSTEINLQVPNLFDVEPEKVIVTSSSIKATNGDDGTAFNENNYTYADGIVSIKTVNEADENNKVSWVKNSTDEYIVNLIYNVGEDNSQLTSHDSPLTAQISNLTSKVSLYNNEQKELEKEISGELKLPEPSQSVVSYFVNNHVKEISKGYMLVKDAANTEYKQEIKVNIGYTPIINNIEINKKQEYYIDENENKYKATTYYKEMALNRENLVKILGENGTVSIISNGISIATLDKDTTSYIFEEEISDLIILTSKPIQEGDLKLETTKYIKSLEYKEEVINNINKIVTSIIGRARLIEEEASTEISLVQPTLQITSSIKSNNLSTVIENENVEIRVALQTNNNTNRLFKNPVIEIELPSYIEDVKVNTINILYNTELVAKTGNITTNKAGNKVITIILEGEQTKFNDILSVEGTTLIIGANITVDKTAPSITEKMKVRVLNNKKEIVETSSNINYMAPTGIITLNSISGYSNNQEELTSMSGEQEIGKIDVAAKSRIATEKITIINNNDYTCGNIMILGRTPSEGNKSLSAGNDLGSTFTAKVVSEIKAIEGVDDNSIVVYYSENENATKDLSNNANGWTTVPKNLSNVKSYLIVVEQQVIKGDKLVFTYDIEIPEGLSRDESTFSVYQVSYTNLDGALKGTIETVAAPIVGLSTGTGPELKVELSANVQNGANVKEGQRIEYTIKVTNIGKTEVRDIAVEADIPNGSYYTTRELDSTKYIYVKNPSVKKYTNTIKKLTVGQSAEAKFLLTVGSRIQIEDFISREDYETDEQYQNAIKELISLLGEEINSTNVEVVSRATTYDNGQPVVFTSNKMINEKEKAYLGLELEMEDARIEAGKYITYDLSINKLGIDNLNNVQILCEVPKGLKYDSSLRNEEVISEKVEDSKIIWTINELEVSTNIKITFMIDEITENKDISLKMIGTCNEFNGTIESNTETFTVGLPKIEISHSSNNTVGYMTEGDEIVYTLAVKNTGTATAYNVKITDYLSEGLTLKLLKYTLGNDTDTRTVSAQNPSLTMDIPANETLIIELIVRANELRENTEKTVSNKFEVETANTNKITSSTLEHKVTQKRYTVNDNNQVSTTNSISGLAWLDENSNGIREIDEKTLPQIPVVLINENGKTVASSITDENGAYVFNNLSAGNYIVIFLYDMANYDITAYGVGENTTNNDVVAMKVNIDGIDTNCGATNLINLTTNIYNIDLGLVISPKFDLSLTKTISKVTVQTSKGTTTNSYNNTKLEKIEIPSKNLNGAVVAIEYTITIANNGAIPGYASKIVDYLSQTDLKFNSETNTDWYLGTDGNLYNSTLGNRLLNPGESANLKLVLTKQVTENNTGLTNNTAEIYEAYNDEGIKDYNSTPANKAQNENDLGQADIIIGLKTGVILYIGIVLIFISILTIGIYVLNKKVINNSGREVRK